MFLDKVTDFCHQTFIVKKSYYFREGMVDFIFVQEEASPESQDFIAGAVLMG